MGANRFSAKPWPERFWAKVNRTDGCWLWTAASTGRGYGVIQREGRARVAHRVAWELTNGPIPEGLMVRHRCDVRLCVRPDHLELGEHADNMADMRVRGRAAAGTRNAMHLYPDRRPRGDRSGARRHPETIRRGSQQRVATITEADVPMIRARWASGERLAAIAASFRTSVSVVSRVGGGRSWKHVPGEIGERPRDERERRWG